MDELKMEQGSECLTKEGRASRNRRFQNNNNDDDSSGSKELRRLHMGSSSRDTRSSRCIQIIDSGGGRSSSSSSSFSNKNKKKRTTRAQVRKRRQRSSSSSARSVTLSDSSSSSRSEESKSEDDDDDDDYKSKGSSTKPKKSGGRQQQAKRKDGELERCKICDDGGELMCCDRCPLVYHPQCLRPKLEKVPDGDWLCPYCSCEPIEGEVRQILTWRWAPGESEEYRNIYFATPPPKRKYMALPMREYLVHLKGHSYWNVKWVTTQQMLTYHPYILQPMNKLDRWNTEKPPQLDYDDDDDDVDPTLYTSQLGLDNSLKERFYDHGIRPAWLQIHRILNHEEDKKNNTTAYLTKWRELSYEFCSWEDEESCKDPLLLPEFKRQIQIYKEFRNYFENREDKKSKKKSSKKEKDDDFDYKIIGIPPKVPAISLRSKNSKYNFGEDLPFLDSSAGLSLHEYQIEGLNWLRHSWQQGTDTILADEMGLGKTIQAITFLYSLYKEGHCTGPFLVSAPLSTVVNWEREFEKWAPDFYVVTYTGEKNCRSVIREQELTYDENAAHALASVRVCRLRSRVKFHVLLTSYEFITLDSTCLQSVDWSIVVVDEAHRLKNSASKFFKFLASYKTNYKLLMTGTPLQNNLEELYHLLNFLCPKKFNNLEEFLEEFNDINKEEQVKKLHDMLGPHMLRRLKSDVLKAMPGKSEFLVRIELSPMQKQCYKDILTKNFEALNSTGGRKATFCMIMMDLKKCCNHPYLFSAHAFSASVVHKGEARERYELESLTAASGKLILLRKMLAKLKSQEGHRVLIFSQMTTMLDILEEFLDGEGYGYERIDGTIRGVDRQMAIDRFNDPKSKSFVFLLSTKAGGLGINLATADTVIIYDSDWNPHNDIQALSRAHRIGQKNKVLIYRFVTRKTIEERISQVAKKKMMLNQLIVESNRAGARGRPAAGASQGGELSLSKQEMEKILRFGVEDLFKDTDAAITYTDEAIEELLDRSETTGESAKETEVKDEPHWINDYLQSFKVASYTETTEEEPPPPKLEEDKKEESTVNEEASVSIDDPNYWAKVLKLPVNPPGSEDWLKGGFTSEELGRGKRSKKMMRESGLGVVTTVRKDGVDDDSDQDETYEADEGDIDSDEYEYDEDYKGPSMKLGSKPGDPPQQSNLNPLMASILAANFKKSSMKMPTPIPNSKKQIQYRPKMLQKQLPALARLNVKHGQVYPRPVQPRLQVNVNGGKVISAQDLMARQIQQMISTNNLIITPNDGRFPSQRNEALGLSSGSPNHVKPAFRPAQKVMTVMRGVPNQKDFAQWYQHKGDKRKQNMRTPFSYHGQQIIEIQAGGRIDIPKDSTDDDPLALDISDPLGADNSNSDPLVTPSSSTNWKRPAEEEQILSIPGHSKNVNPHDGIKKLKVAFGDVGLQILGVQDSDDDDCIVIE